MQSLFWLFLLFFLILIVVPITINIKISYDPLKNKGVLGFRIFRFKVAFSSFKFKGLGIEVKTRAKKPQEVELKASRKDIIYLKRLIALFRDKLRIHNMFLDCKIGLEDAFQSAVVSGAINSVVCSLFAFVKNFKQTGSIKIKSKTEYNQKIFKIRINFKLSISILDLIYCLLFAFVNTRRTLKHEQISARKFSRRTFGFKH